jgi:hypothetical protein
VSAPTPPANAVLTARVAELEERLARLERAASRNSGNSSLPPSMDDQSGRTPPPGKPQRGKRGSGTPASSRARRDRTWPGARIPIARCRISRGERARAARTWPAWRTWG